MPKVHNCFGLIRSRVINLHDQDVTRPNVRQFIHDDSNISLLDHSLHRDPAALFQSVDCRRSLARCDFTRSFELVALNVVAAENI